MNRMPSLAGSLGMSPQLACLLLPRQIDEVVQRDGREDTALNIGVSIYAASQMLDVATAMGIIGRSPAATASPSARHTRSWALYSRLPSLPPASTYAARFCRHGQRRSLLSADGGTLACFRLRFFSATEAAAMAAFARRRCRSMSLPARYGRFHALRRQDYFLAWHRPRHLRFGATARLILAFAAGQGRCGRSAAGFKARLAQLPDFRLSSGGFARSRVTGYEMSALRLLMAGCGSAESPMPAGRASSPPARSIHSSHSGRTPVTSPLARPHASAKLPLRRGRASIGAFSRSSCPRLISGRVDSLSARVIEATHEKFQRLCRLVLLFLSNGSIPHLAAATRSLRRDLLSSAVE